MNASRLLAALVVLASLGTARAYEFEDDGSAGHNYTWSQNFPPLTVAYFRAGAHTFGPGTEYREKLGNIVGIWNDHPGLFFFDLSYDDNDVDPDNGQNEIWFTTDDSIVEPEHGGITLMTYTVPGYHFYEVDIVFHRNAGFTTSTEKSKLWSYGGSHRPFQTTLLHELGHALGLAHENDEYNIMGEDWTHLNANHDTAHYYPGEDACDGAVALYGEYPGSREDVSVSHWKWSGHCGEGGEYSDHTRTALYEEGTWNELEKLTGTREPVFKVSRGQTVDVEFTLENSGTSTQHPRVRYYLSTDNDIDNSDDDVLIECFPGMSRDKVYRRTQTLTIPSTFNDGTPLASGTKYWLGIIVDPLDEITEVRQYNNATYVAIYIK